MPIKLALVLDAANARRTSRDSRVEMVLLERTLGDLPRAAAARRWAGALRRTFPAAELVPYAWHLVTHGPEDALPSRSARTMPGDPHRFGRLRTTPETAGALDATLRVVEALDATRIAVRTPAGLSPGVLGRRALEGFFAGCKSRGLAVTWEPEGLWTAAGAIELAWQNRIDAMLPAFTGGRAEWESDARTLLVGAGAWLRVDGVGPKREVQPAQIDALLEDLEHRTSGVVAFAGMRALDGLRQLASALGR
jgi:hypothetical protein